MTVCEFCGGPAASDLGCCDACGDKLASLYAEGQQRIAELEAADQPERTSP
jgi:hypothetical protein